MPTVDPTATAEAVLALLMDCRRTSGDDPCAVECCPACGDPHLDRIVRFVRDERPVQLVLPAFPAKSPNRAKVLGPLPDRGERLALDFLEGLCRRVGEVYRPGARLRLCADGRVFSDLVDVPDADVTAYGEELNRMLGADEGSCLDTFDLDEAFPGGDFDSKRRALLADYGQPAEHVREEVRAGAPVRGIYNGIARFLFEDLLFLEGARRSRTSVRNEAGARAYEVVRRSAAWSDVIAARFPGAVRLSIHPQPAHGQKLGIFLVPSRDNWLTPWHGAAVEVGGRFILMKRWQAEQLGATLVYREGRPSHFEARRIVCLESLSSPSGLAAAAR